jgi:hypothetical protein
MGAIKCKLIKYRGKYYLIFADGRRVKVGDNVLTPNFNPVGKVQSLLGGYDDEGMCYVDNTSAKLYAKSLDIIAAKDDEIEIEFKTEENLGRFYNIYEESGQILHNKDNTIILTFEGVD